VWLGRNSFGNDRHLLDAENLLRRRRGLRQQSHVDDLVGDLLLNDQLVLGIDRDLNVVAHGNMGVHRHGPAVRVGQRDLVFSGLIQLRQHLRAARQPRTDGGNLLGQVLDPRAACRALADIALIEAPQVILALGIGRST